jgi:hypothetical protein
LKGLEKINRLVLYFLTFLLSLVRDFVWDLGETVKKICRKTMVPAVLFYVAKQKPFNVWGRKFVFITIEHFLWL